jgi:hypothetical protein
MLIIKYLLVAFLSFALTILINEIRKQMLLEDFQNKRNRISSASFIRNSLIMIALHVYFCTLLFKVLIWWKLLLAWVVIGQFFGWLVGGMRGVGKNLGIWGLLIDVIGASFLVWVIQKYIV